MQIINIKKIWGKKFRCHDEFEFEFPNDKLIAITGKNGKGKSTYLMAVCTLLYGEAADGTGISDMVNDRVNKDLELHGELEIDSDKYEIHRYYKHSKFKNNLILKKNGSDISLDTVTETYKLISKLILPKDVFLNTIYFSQQVKDFFTALTDARQKDIFNAILDLKIYQTYLVSAKEKYSKVEQELLVEQKKLNNNISDIEKEKIKLQYEKDAIEKNIQDRKNNISDLEIKIVGLNDIIKSLDKEFSEINFDPEKYNALISQLASIKEKLPDIDVNFELFKSSKKKELEKLTEELRAKANSDFITRKQSIEELKSTELQTKSTLINSLTEKKSIITEKYNGIANAMYSKYVANKKVLDESLASLKVKKQNLEKDLLCSDLVAAKDKELQQLLSKQSNLEVSARLIKSQADSLLGDIPKHEAKKSSMVENLSKPNPICTTCNQEIKNEDALSHLKKELEEVENTIKGINDKVANLRIEFAPIKTQLQSIVKEQIPAATKKHDDLIAQKKSSINEEINSAIKNIVSVTADGEKLDKEYNIEKTNSNTLKQLELDEVNKYLTSIENSYKEKIAGFDSEITQIKIEISKELESKLSEQTSKYSQVIITEKENCDKLKENYSDQLLVVRARIAEMDIIKTKVESINNSISFNKSTITYMENQKKQLSEQTDDNSKILKVESTIKSLETDKVNIESSCALLTKKLEAIKFWIAGFSDKGIPSMLIDNAIPFMNSTAREILETIIPGKFILSFDTLSETKSGEIRDKFSVNILNTENGANKHSKLSGGEKRQIDVAIMRTLRLLAENLYQKRLNITLLDEVLDSLDTDNSGLFCKFLKQISKDQCVILVTHNLLTNSECDDVLRI